MCPMFHNGILSCCPAQAAQPVDKAQYEKLARQVRAP